MVRRINRLSGNTALQIPIFIDSMVDDLENQRPSKAEEFLNQIRYYKNIKRAFEKSLNELVWNFEGDPLIPFNDQDGIFTALNRAVLKIDSTLLRWESSYNKFLGNGETRPADLWLQLNFPRIQEILYKLIDSNYIVKSETGFDWKKSQALLAKLFKENGGWEKGIKKYFTVNGKYPETIDAEIRKNTTPRNWNDLEIIISD